MTTETTQLQLHNDTVRCRCCNRQNHVQVYPDLHENKFTCRYCQQVQVWNPSAAYRRIVLNK